MKTKKLVVDGIDFTGSNYTTLHLKGLTYYCSVFTARSDRQFKAWDDVSRDAKRNVDMVRQRGGSSAFSLLHKPFRRHVATVFLPPHPPLTYVVHELYHVSRWLAERRHRQLEHTHVEYAHERDKIEEITACVLEGFVGEWLEANKT